MSNRSEIKHTVSQILSQSETPAAPVARPPVNPPSKVVKYIDRDMTCSGCGASFVWKSEEQSFFFAKGLRHKPKWCASCRKTRRQYFMDHPTLDRNKK